MPRPITYCDRCENTVYADDLHSCYDAALVRTVHECEQRVVAAAERLIALRCTPADAPAATTAADPHAEALHAEALHAEALHALTTEVEHLWTQRGYGYAAPVTRAGAPTS